LISLIKYGLDFFKRFRKIDRWGRRLGLLLA
jgi:hypothetical protein